MDGELFSWLISQGGFAGVAALFFFLWQRSETKAETFRLENVALREGQIATEKAHSATVLELTEKRFADNQRVEGVVTANAEAMRGNAAAIGTLLPTLQVIAGRGVA